MSTLTALASCDECEWQSHREALTQRDSAHRLPTSNASGLAPSPTIAMLRPQQGAPSMSYCAGDPAETWALGLTGFEVGSHVSLSSPDYRRWLEDSLGSATPTVWCP